MRFSLSTKVHTIHLRNFSSVNYGFRQRRAGSASGKHVMRRAGSASGKHVMAQAWHAFGWQAWCCRSGCLAGGFGVPWWLPAGSCWLAVTFCVF